MALKNFASSLLDRALHTREKKFRFPIRRVGRGEQHAAGFEQWQRGDDKLSKIFFHPERAVFLRLRKGRRIENNGIKAAFLFSQPPQPVEGVAENKIVRGGIESVQSKVALAP